MKRGPGLFRRHPKKLTALGLLLVGPLLFHLGVKVATRIEAPPVTSRASEVGEPIVEGDLRTLGRAYARRRGKILEVRLVGSPEKTGHDHARLLYPEMVEDEGTLYGQLEEHLPFPPARWLLMDMARLEFRKVDRGMGEAFRREIAAEARGFSPDPYAGFLPTYHRMIFLHALYDIALSFEHSPLLGCTSFTLTGDAAEGGHVMLARNFDFEAGPVFDEKKTVFVMHEEGKIPYAAVAWPGLVGAVTGMNAEGVSLVVHGGRAREPGTEGEPVVQTMRAVLGQAKSTAEALKMLEASRPMVSHLVLLADPSGDTAVAERAPGAPMFVRRMKAGEDKLPLTNHFEGPLAEDPANRSIEAVTSTRPRRIRLDELLSALPKGATPAQIVGVLRDKKGVGASPLGLGNRKAIDALIATHSVVMDATARAMWVSEGPHLAGRYLRFDLKKLFDPSFEPRANESVEELPPDPIFADGTYQRWEAAGSPHKGEP